MEAREYRTQDKSDWGHGPWQEEPDKMQFVDQATGLPCLIVRNHSGALCGYVGVPENHKAFELHYDAELVRGINVHGGLTFSDHCTKGGAEETHICHVPAPGEPDNVWWFGFDCAHSGDCLPAYHHGSVGLFGDRIKYRTINYVKRHISKLALQLNDL
jgi:hypothetical protein